MSADLLRPWSLVWVACTLLLSGTAWAETTYSLRDGERYVWDIDDNSGEIVDGSDDAFDGFGQLLVDDVPYENDGGADDLSTEGREVVFPVVSMAELEVSRKVFVSGSDPLCRMMEILHNPTEGEITIDVAFEGNLGADAEAEIRRTTDGDSRAEASDTWIVADDDNADGGNPAVGFLFRGPGPRQPTRVTFSGEDGATDQVTISWEGILVPAGATVIIVTVLTQQSSLSDAAFLLPPLAALSDTPAVSGVSDDELVSIYNFSLTPGAFEASTLSYGLNSGGSFILVSPELGLRLGDDDDWLIDDSSPWEMWMLESARFTYVNQEPADVDDLPLYMTGRTTAGPSFSVEQTCLSDGLHIQQTVTHEDGADTLRVHVALTNRGLTPINGLKYLRSVDPDPDNTAGDTETENDLLDDTDGVVLIAEGVITGRTLGFVTDTEDAVAAVVPAPFPTDPDAVMALSGDPDGLASDGALYLVWDFGDLEPEASVELTFWYVVSGSHEGALDAVTEIGINIAGVTDRDGDEHTWPDDCDDTNPVIFPGAIEECDELDNDCDGATDEDLGFTLYRDLDEDGFGDPTESIANACDGTRDGYVDNGDDCDDLHASAHPGGEEICDEIDNNCDGEVDEGVELETFYRDGDGDGHAGDTMTIEGCVPPVGYARESTDCDDLRPDVFPDAYEWCDGVDND